MLDIQQLQFTIPAQLRDKLGIEPGFSELEYQEANFEKEKVFIRLTPEKRFSLISKNREGVYRVSHKGQITVPKHILVTLGIKDRTELEIDFDGKNLFLVRGYMYQLKDIIQSQRPSFFSGGSDVLTIMPHEHEDDGESPTMRVDNETFHKLIRLYLRLKAKYEPSNSNPWVGVPEDEERGFKDKGISITYDKSTKPETLTIQKLGSEFLPEPIASLWRNRVSFTLRDNTLMYFDKGVMQTQQVLVNSQKVAQIFQRNGRSFGDYIHPEGYPYTTVELYTNDLVNIKQSGSIIVEYCAASPLFGKRTH
ncbi:AbrB/MazE/SpoVT family DNA-binding domain-containing protein [Paenibacillus ehimensis]|uniref:AbrB/MazE/SpoVT family DNA-binding domain-containing protein n=1 Tax=Paenibacillus ehimensis TaxID=79264 RepID=UPI002DB9C1BC|nr:AbrB/MazE/SpoVT family DNA-binding domain-containing protein [Paenibacillus ehimensis]MEC0207895.1 AbrB/MazE/SpoVT family DNA-binding domain-containing protein [Paenibacillus ehimensis]